MMKKSILPYVSKPGRYLAHEYNAKTKKWHDADIHFALVFPDLYEIGMSHLGLQILYHILNEEPDVVAERCFCPDLDAEKIHRQRDIVLQSLESSRPLRSFDVIGITLPYELCYSNILTILDLASIPFFSCDRDDSFPLILGGGSCSLNPEPVADLFDAILLGDGEEAIVEISKLLQKTKKEQGTKTTLLAQMEEIKGVYIPSHYVPQYNAEQRISKIARQDAGFKKVERRIVRNLDRTSHLFKPLVPNAKIVHDRLGVEIARGCTRGCRFCQAGMTYRPVRERTPQQILDIARQGLENSGFEELALLSLSTGDYSCIDYLLPRLMDNFASQYVSVSMPSMRVGTLSQPVMDQIKRVRKTGFTIAPEAGSERLRQAINKGITEVDLLTTCRDAFSLGWKNIKLYFMIGLPTETQADVEEIAILAAKARKTADTIANKRGQITVSVGTFVPKPHTPFQWERQISLKESQDKIFHLKQNMPSKNCKFKWHDPAMSFLEGVFSRGDRRLVNLIIEAWKDGARLDGWSDHFSLPIWQEAAKACNIDLADYLRERHHDEILPWQHLQSGVDESFLLDEMEKTHSGEYTPDCRYHGCQNCGLCDFENIAPIVHNPQKKQMVAEENTTGCETMDSKEIDDEFHCKYMVTYSRLGTICYLGHLEILQLLFRSLRRAKIRTHFSKGFNPSPKISFGAALPVGVESLCEYFVMDLPEMLKDTQATCETLNDCLPEGLRIKEIALYAGRIPQSIISQYEVTLPQKLTQQEKESIIDFQRADEYLITRHRKGKSKEIDIRPLLHSISLTDERALEVKLVSTAGAVGIKVQELLKQLLQWEDNLINESRIVKISWEKYSDS